MAKVKFNVKGVESGGGDRPLPKPGVYRCKITSCVVGQPTGKDKRIEVVYTITDGDHKNFPIYDYINLESEAAAWKLRQFLEAVGLVSEKKESGDFDPEELVGTALSVKTKVQPETEQYAASVKATLLMPLDGDADDDDAEDLSDDDGDDDNEDVDYSAMDLDELKEAAEEAELDVAEIIKGKKKKAEKEAALREALEENDASDDDDDDADDADDSDDDDGDEDDDETYTEEELEELDDDDLVDVAFGYEDEDGDEIEGVLDEEEKSEYVKTKGKGKAKKVTVDREALIARILEAQEGDEDDDDGDDETPDYESMDLKALKKLAKERDISDKGSKKVIIARLLKDDQPF